MLSGGRTSAMLLQAVAGCFIAMVHAAPAVATPKAQQQAAPQAGRPDRSKPADASNNQLTIRKTHSGTFVQGQKGATYTVTVSNPVGARTHQGTVVVTELPPPGLALVAMTGSGWRCYAISCARNDALPGGASYPPITVAVNVAATASSPQVNKVVLLQGGSETLVIATDSTIITSAQPVLSITKAHVGDFTQGQQNATYSVMVSNAAGAAPTSGAVTVTDTVPSGLTLVSMSGTGWQCSANACTRSDSLAAGASYPPITVTVNVAADAMSPQVNAVAVSGGGAASASATDSTVVVANPPVLSITKTHSGNFTQGQQNAAYAVTVSNAAAAGSTSGVVTVTDTVPSGLTLVSLTGTGWQCTANTCTRSDSLVAGASYPPISVTVNVATDATSPQVNAVEVSGGGSASASATDSTTIEANPPVLTIVKSHTGDFTQGQQGATYSIVVSNAAGAGPTSGIVTVTDTTPSGLSLISMTGAGWECVSATCTRSDALAPGASYPSIAVSVKVAANATSPQINTVSVTGGGSAGANASDSTVVITTDQAPPSLTIASPAAGAFVFQNKPPIDVSYSDPSGVDQATLVFTANGSALTVDCALGASGGRCTPVTPLPDGAVTLGAMIRDTLGNQASAGVSFTVDAAPVAVSITSPADRLITNTTSLDVTGTVGAGVTTVTVNDVAAALSGTTFNATVPLRDGVNMIVAVGTKTNGKTGTDSIDVTRDTIAPIVRIDSPADGFVSANNAIPITGLVNDIVNGGLNASVTVNGVPAAVGDGTFMVTTVPLVRGPNTIRAIARDFAGNQGEHAITVRYEPPVGARLSILSGNGQAAEVKHVLPQPFAAVVKDEVGNPLAGRVVKFQVSRNNGLLHLTAGDEGQRSLQIPTDGSGRASVLLTLGDTAGQGNNRVLVSALGVTGEVEFCASGLTAPPQKILMTMGDNQRGAVGQPLPTPMEALVVDRDGNPVKDADVTFAVLKGGGNIDGSESAVHRTGVDGIARAVLTLGPDPGIANNVVNATFEGLATAAATFTASALVPGDPAQTTFKGVVLDNALTPIPGATVRIDHTTVQALTDDQGQFLLTNVPVGKIHLLIDPTKSPRPETFPPLAFETVTIAGQANVLGQPILIPALDTEGSKIVGGPEDVVLKMPGVPGLELKVFANSVTCRDGSHQCRVTISQVHLDKVPMPPPSGTVFMPPAWTVQPAGTRFTPPAQITIPNDGMPPGRQIDIFQFDHDLNQFINIGKGTTREDGLVIVSDPGFGITAAGWGGCGQPQPPTTCAGKCDDGNVCNGTESCANGSCQSGTNAALCTACTPGRACDGSGSCATGTALIPKICSQLGIEYKNVNTLGCGGDCGAKIQFDVTAVTHSCDGVDLAGAKVTETVTTDGGCLPGGVTTGPGCPIGAGNAITGCTDTYGLCAAASSFPIGSCTETYTQKLFVGSCHAETRTITFTITRDPAGCSGTVTRK